MKTKFVIIGAGNRGLGCFAKGFTGWEGKSLPDFTERSEITAIVDLNLSRARAAAAEIKLPDLPVYKDVRTAQKENPADWCIVTVPDCAHREVVVNALESGLGVVVDKPLATSAWECDLIIEAAKRTGKGVRVGHNMRYHPWTMEAAKRIRDGVIGDILSVEAAELLDYSHGGDYFHRWHSDFSKSAGLMNHKCCHHLDMINWILDDDPIEVSAFGARTFYVPRPDLNCGERCLDCPIGKDCPHYFNMDMWDGVWQRIYHATEDEDGYIRDRCVFSDRHTVNDQENLCIKYSKGTLASFTMVTFAPKEHCYFHFTGTKGRIEMGSNSWEGVPYVRITHADNTVENMHFETDWGEHAHGGSDVKLIADILGMEGSLPMQKAMPEEARRAVLIADLAARSIADNGRPVKAEEAGKDYPPAPPYNKVKI